MTHDSLTYTSDEMTADFGVETDRFGEITEIWIDAIHADPGVEIDREEALIQCAASFEAARDSRP